MQLCICIYVNGSKFSFWRVLLDSWVILFVMSCLDFVSIFPNSCLISEVERWRSFLSTTVLLIYSIYNISFYNAKYLHIQSVTFYEKGIVSD